MKRVWRLWCKSVGEKSGSSDSESDKIAIIRTLIILQSVITNLLITWNILRRWYE